MKDMGLMDPPKRFFAYADDGNAQGTVVDIIGTLTLMTSDGQALPPLRVRMVPNPVDDLLMAAPDLDALGFDAKRGASC